ncbi:MAG: PqqD family protein [Candidatus Cloacimonetes bacterium]|nr:PqqD family protein [Candidatus Cloacimonadota bacterium]
MNITRLQQLAVSDNGFAFDPSTGHSYQLNMLAAEIVDLLLKQQKRQEILEHLTMEFKVESDVAAQDFDFFMLSLSNLGLVETSDALSPAPGQ